MKLGGLEVVMEFANWSDGTESKDQNGVRLDGSLQNNPGVQERIFRGNLLLWSVPPVGYASLATLRALWQTSTTLPFEDPAGIEHTVIWRSPFVVTWASSERAWATLPVELVRVLV